MELVEVNKWLPPKRKKVLAYVVPSKSLIKDFSLEEYKRMQVHEGFYIAEVRKSERLLDICGRPLPPRSWIIWGCPYYMRPEVTHWMPLPDKPKGVIT